MKMIHITAGPFSLQARLEDQKAPLTCRRFEELLPYTNKIIHVRWSGEAVWIPMGDFHMDLDYENHTSHPSRGDVLLYPGGFSETEIILAYGSCCFASKMGQLAGNHFLTVVEGLEHLPELGRMVLWQGAQDITFHKP